MKLELQKVEDWGLFENIARPLVIAGPCSAENEEQVFQTAYDLKSRGINVLRAGLWKPRTRPNCFEGVGEIGLPWLLRVRKELGMKISTEVANIHHVHEALKAGIDMLWIGARTSANPFAMQDIADALKGTDIPVLVKNPVNPDVELWIGALERLNMAGLKKLGVIHRGFSAYGKHKYRNVPQWQLPIEIRRRYPEILMLCDPSHIAGKRMYVPEIAQQAMDLGFDGLIIESHICPDAALSDAAQQLTPESVGEMLGELVIRHAHTENIQYRESIDELRARIDAIDSELLDLLALRMKVSDEIGQYKKQNNITILQAGRWEKILQKVFAYGDKQGLDSEFLEKIFKAIHQASIDRQTSIMQVKKNERPTD
ncbi:MAG: bifunctional 3-deoxy-7-phosphoheptulonate synthase/chorismate mutase type II [Odoribacter sp.]|nr:bifunctional 3-deoxy-7-phosphoheptulonate synthase/chorismate mutase type II [Odoribacter sp.]